MPHPDNRTVKLSQFAQPAVTILAVVVCFCLWALVARPLPQVQALGPATPLPETPLILSPRPSPRPVYDSQPAAMSVEQEVKARQIYGRACAPCHASGGPHDLGKATSYKHGSDDQAVYRSIKSGFPGTGMGGSKLSDATIWALVNYLSRNRS